MKVGVYICRCGSNIGDKIDVASILAEVAADPDVAVARDHNVLCSEAGLAFLIADIRECQIDRVVIAACTPKMYEQKFMRACEQAGVNPYLMQLTNIREQCAWITADAAEATDKARRLIRAAVKRVQLHQPIEPRRIEVQPDVLVIGGGIAGLEAALTLSQTRRRVYLVEQSPSLGGMTVRFEDVYPTLECAPCMISPMLQAVLQKDNIEVLTNSELTGIVGSFGNFTATIRTRARYVDAAACIGCGACFEPCPVEVANEYEEGLATRKAIFWPQAGALPNVPTIDEAACRRLAGGDCEACRQICPVAAINYDDQERTLERKVGAVVVAVGASMIDLRRLPQYGCGEHANVLTSMQLERMNCLNGPTGGRVVMRNGEQPASVVFVHCVGRQQKGYCSGVCCMDAIKLSHLLKKKQPAVTVTHLYTDLCLPKPDHQRLYEETQGQGVRFLPVEGVIGVDRDGARLRIAYIAWGQQHEVFSDMVVLMPALEASPGLQMLAELLDVPLDRHGFPAVEHAHLKPFISILDGMYLAGACQGPKDIADSVAQSAAACARIMSKLVPGETMEVEPKTTEIEQDNCSGCGCCIVACPYRAVSRDPNNGASVVDASLCRGCGTCVAACPSGAARARHFTGQQIMAEITELLQ